MAYFARLENNIVIEIIQADTIPEFHPSITIVSCDENTSEDDIYQNGFFITPQPDIDDLKAEKIEELQGIYESKVNAGIEFEANNYQIDDSARQNMNDVYTKLADEQANPHGGVWRNTDNQMIAMDDAKVKQFIDSVFDYRFQLMNVLWTHKDNIRAMTRSEDVQLYDIELGWPPNG